MPTKHYDELLQEELIDPEICAEYLTQSLLTGGAPSLLVALEHVIKAHGGVELLSEVVNLSPVHLEKILKGESPLHLPELLTIAETLGITLLFRPIENDNA
jgi:DNA-binding phage protein